MAQKVQIVYQEMERAANKLSAEQDALQQAYQSSYDAFQRLDGRWKSPAASEFFKQTSDIMDRTKKLVDAVQHATDTLHSIINVLHTTEQNASNQFNWLRN